MMKNRKLLETTIRKIVRNVLTESTLEQEDNELYNMVDKELESAHSSFNQLLFVLYANSKRSEFARNMYDFIKSADDAILLARRNL